MLRLNFILGSNVIFLCFGVWLFMIISLKQRKIKFEPRIKLNRNIYMGTSELTKRYGLPEMDKHLSRIACDRMRASHFLSSHRWRCDTTARNLSQANAPLIHKGSVPFISVHATKTYVMERASTRLP